MLWANFVFSICELEYGVPEVKENNGVGRLCG